MDISSRQAAQAFLEKHRQLIEMSFELAPYEERYLSMNGLGSAGMEVDGVLDYYTEKSRKRSALVAQMKQLRTEAGDQNILAELEQMTDARSAMAYIRRVPLKDPETPDRSQSSFFRRIFRRFR